MFYGVFKIKRPRDGIKPRDEISRQRALNNKEMAEHYGKKEQ